MRGFGTALFSRSLSSSLSTSGEGLSRKFFAHVLEIFLHLMSFAAALRTLSFSKVVQIIGLALLAHVLRPMTAAD